MENLTFENLQDFLSLSEGQDNIKCPFQYNNDGSFQDCIFRRCMAYRSDGKIFWCARLEKRDCTDSMLHSVEIL